MRARTWLVIAALAAPLAAHADKPRGKRRIYVRGVVAHVDPRITTSDVELDATGLAASAIGDGAITDAGITVDAATRPTAIVGFVVPGLHGRLSIETLVGVPTVLKIEATGRLADESLAPEAAGLPTGIPALGHDLAEATVAPPLITAIFRPLQRDRISLLVGAGASMLFVFDERVTNPVLTEVSTPELSISHAFGAVLQAGVEARLWRRVIARIDAKYIAYRASHATIEHIEVRTDLPLLPTVEVGSASMDLSVRPVIVQAGIGADF